jgi:hypothetical protein
VPWLIPETACGSCADPLDRRIVEQYEQLGVHRLVLLPQPDADSEHRHAPVPVERILRNIDTVAETIIHL